VGSAAEQQHHFNFTVCGGPCPAAGDRSPQADESAVHTPPVFGTCALGGAVSVLLTSSRWVDR